MATKKYIPSFYEKTIYAGISFTMVCEFILSKPEYERSVMEKNILKSYQNMYGIKPMKYTEEEYKIYEKVKEYYKEETL